MKSSTGINQQDDQRDIRILVDGHGGDAAPAMVLDALEIALSPSFAARFQGSLTLGVVGQEEVLRPLLQQRGIEDSVSLIPATDVVGMCDSPSHALRRKKDSSIHVGARMVRDGYWDALVSAGNTGALMAISKVLLKTLPGIDRPAIASMIPAVNNGRTLMLDAGANSECTSDHLVQFAIMGSCYMQATERLEHPRVGLLNIGSEDIKGTDVIKMTSVKLAETSLNYIGNVEGTDLFGNDVDVVVCDGFVGNVALKTMEGTARFLADSMRSELTSGVVAKAGALMARSALKRFKDKVNPGKYNGAPLLGLNGIVVKSHGGADAESFVSALTVACHEVSENLTDRITESIQEMVES
ncbi:glycerol-3-phosphate acyltransferase PlsX [Mariprofundus micogutta]|uniref:Phosphate acyltransferase n=1 Tax=Mariprofundus micogutta TaxID=1921010 RepID=A0A1L8CJW1_9PROT|nr:phosphate acyltransferase PlsX [Mariprofundus micogutta]GAV19181.1 glycerol-3-phosphate acyltransferase PlsX [Mariprofundus micogutta]